MSELRIEHWSMPAAELGPPNPLPPLRGQGDLHALGQKPGTPEELAKNMAYGGHPANLLPYTLQDRYTRQRQAREFRVAVLENEFLRAGFLLELGGRLWSLVHKPSGRELLEVNPIFQPANLALRNAWFSGGVEWNMGIIGHSPFTCSPLFAARLESPDGTPVLRLYEWERIRQIPFQIDAYLPDGSPMLWIRVRLVNPHQREVPMYWWSNMAVPETPPTRVLVPAEKAYRYSYGALEVVPVPGIRSMDVSYSTNLPGSTDFFYHLPAGQRPWIAALDGEGRGLVQVSTPSLKGRKLFAWGMGTGGRNWQQFLSTPGRAYLEIQAGLARTQMEYLPMPPGAEWAWLEAYGLMEADPHLVHGADWGQARQAVEHGLEGLIPSTVLNREFERGGDWADHPPLELIQRGSGWGALERLRRKAAGDPPFCSPGLDFDGQSLGEEQAPWLVLLHQGRLPEIEPNTEPGSYLVQAEWRALLEGSLRTERNAHWFSLLHLGVMRYSAGDRGGARRAWEASLEQAATPWAMRNLAVLAGEEERFAEAADLYAEACRRLPSLLPLAVECGCFLTETGRPQEWLNLAAEFPPAVRAAGRIRLLEAQAGLELGRPETVERLLAEKVLISDLREGERSLSSLWYDYQARRLSMLEKVPLDDALRARVRREYPLPQEIDFGMQGDKEPEQ